MGSSARAFLSNSTVVMLGNRYQAGEACMNDRVGLSPACTVCWVDNMACDASTCKADCLLAKLTKQPPVDKNGNLSACVFFPLPPFLFCLFFPYPGAWRATRTIAGTRSFDAPGPIAGEAAFIGSNLIIL